MLQASIPGRHAGLRAPRISSNQAATRAIRCSTAHVGRAALLDDVFEEERANLGPIHLLAQLRDALFEGSMRGGIGGRGSVSIEGARFGLGRRQLFLARGELDLPFIAAIRARLDEGPDAGEATVVLGERDPGLRQPRAGRNRRWRLRLLRGSGATGREVERRTEQHRPKKETDTKSRRHPKGLPRKPLRRTTSQLQLPTQGCFWPVEVSGDCGYYWSIDEDANPGIQGANAWGVGFSD